MSSCWKKRMKRITETLDPQPQEMLTVIITHCGAVDLATVKPPQYYIGRFASCCFLGGTEKAQRQEVKRLAASGEFDRDPFGSRAISEGSDGEGTEGAA